MAWRTRTSSKGLTLLLIYRACTSFMVSWRTVNCPSTWDLTVLGRWMTMSRVPLCSPITRVLLSVMMRKVTSSSWAPSPQYPSNFFITMLCWGV